MPFHADHCLLLTDEQGAFKAFRNAMAGLLACDKAAKNSVHKPAVIVQAGECKDLPLHTIVIMAKMWHCFYTPVQAL
jgi:hypothetical protein